MITSQHRVWIAEGGQTLVKDGHPKARVLLARAGQKLHPKEFEHFENASEFFPVAEKEEPAKKTQKAKG